MELKVRKLNAHEKYACSIKAAKNIFGNKSVRVYFGWPFRDFEFDSSDHKRPQIKGTVIASASINKRDKVPFESEYSIHFYVIKDLKYGSESEEKFCELYLLLLYKWYQEMLARPEISPSGVENFLVEWIDGDFKTHSYRYH